MDLQFFTFPQNLTNPKKIVFLLHGYGSNGHDLLSLAPDLATEENDTLFISPHAPYPCEIGMDNSYQWFSLAERAEDIMAARAKDSSKILYNFIQQILDKYSLKAENCAILGFSQGSMMTMYTTISYQIPFSCLLCFSGKFLKPQLKAQDIMRIPPVLIVHGEIDEVVPVFCAHEAEVKLRYYKAKEISLNLRPHLGHGIDEEGITLAKQFLLKHLFKK